MYELVNAVSLIGLILAVSLLVIIALQRPSREQSIATLIAMCCVTIWLGYWLRFQATSIEMLVIGKKLNYFGATLVYFVILVFCIHYYQIHRLHWLLVTLAVVGLFFLGMTLTFDKHHLYYTSYYMDTINGLPELIATYSILHTLYAVTILAYSVITLSITIYMFRKTTVNKSDFVNNIALLLVVLIPSICYLVDKIWKPSMDLTPFGLLVAQLNLIYLVAGGKVCDVNILARDYVFESIDEALVITDLQHRYREANKEAKALFPELKDAPPGENIQKLSKEVNLLFENISNENELLSKNNNLYQVKVKRVVDKRNTGGYVLWLEDVTTRHENIKLMQNYQKNLEYQVNEKTARLQKMNEKMISGFAAIAENRDTITGGHIQRTSAYVEAITQELKKSEKYAKILTDEYCKNLKVVAPLHDIGKVSVPDAILDKPAKLTEEEFEIMKEHTTTGAAMISQILDEETELEGLAEDIARYHHEKWTGKGYPEGLHGTEIPLSARIMAVADVFDALVSERPYKHKFSVDQAYDIIHEETGTHFDPDIVAAFDNIKDQITEIRYTTGIE